MRVELPDLLSVLSHELRSPLSVIQGYARLLLETRGPEDRERGMLSAMLEATGRLSALAREASELRTWVRDAPDETHPVAAGHFLDRILAHPAVSRVRLRPDGNREAMIRVRHLDQLVNAVATLAAAAARDVVDTDFELGADTTDEDTCVNFRLSPSVTNAAGSTGRVAFERGGHGLALVLASYVLAAHDAGVASEGVGFVTVRLPKARGAA